MLTPEQIRERLENGRHIADADVWALLREHERLVEGLRALQGKYDRSKSHCFTAEEAEYVGGAVAYTIVCGDLRALLRAHEGQQEQEQGG